MNPTPSHSILIQVKSQAEADRIIGLFRDQLKTIRAHRITSENDLLEHLKDTEQWHLLISDNLHPEVSLPYTLDAIKTQGIDLPVLMLANNLSEESIQQAFNLGVSDIIDKDQGQHFINAALREIQNVIARRSEKQLKQELEELKVRADKLMSEADEAIAYLADGILIECNQPFAEAFGYSSNEDLDCASLIDLVTDDDQDTFKHFLRAFSKGDIEHNSLSFKALKANDEAFDVQVQLSQTALDGEPCIQINLQTAITGEAAAGAAPTEDAATSLPTRYALAEQLSITALQHANKATLAIFAIDDFEQHQSQLLLSGTDMLIKDLSEQVSAQLTTESLGRISDGAIGGIVLQTPDKILETCQAFLSELENHISDIEGRSVQYSCTVCLVKIQNSDAAQLLDNGIAGLHEIRAQHSKNAVDVYTPQEKKPAPKALTGQDSIEDLVEAGAIKILYQPIMSLHGDEVENYEVTVECEDPQLLESLDTAKLDRWCLIESTKALSAHTANGHNTRLIINLTQSGLLDDSLPSWIKVALKASGLPAHSVVLQFAEDDVKNHLKQAMANFASFKSNNQPVSINRFGSDQEPEKLLKHLSPDYLRINGKFTELLTSGGDTQDLKQLLGQVNEMGIKTILPDVQNASVLAASWQLGTHYIQGSYLQLPAPEMNYEFAELG